MSKQFDSMMEGLEELLEYAKGNGEKCRVRKASLPECQSAQELGTREASESSPPLLKGA